MTDLAIYSDMGKLLPPVEEILAGLLEDYPQIQDVEFWAENIDRTVPVLVLGSALPPIKPAFYAHTLSQKQILVTGSAMTELHVALDNLLKPPVFKPMAYKVVNALSWQEEQALGSHVVLDIETGGNYDTCIRPSEKYLLCVGINDGKNIYVYREESLRPHCPGWEQLRRLLRSTRKWVAHNKKFDFPILGVHLGIPVFGDYDTMLMHHSINHGAREHDLESLAVKYLGAPDWKNWAKDYVKKSHDYASIPRDVLYKYNAMDVYWTWHLYKYFSKILAAEPRIIDVARHEFGMSWLFQQVEANGAAIDLDYLNELKAEYDAAEIVALEKIRAITGDEKFNPNSPKQVKEFLADCGIQMHSTAEKLLEGLKLKGQVAEFRDLLLELRGISKMRGTYVNGLLKRRRGNLVFPTFNVHGTATGRLSSTDPNIQNIPRDKKLRKIFVPRAPGRKMVQVDYSQAELRVMASLSNDEHLISLFQPDSPDFFDAMMPSAFPGINLKKMDPGLKKDKRAKLKATVYGLAYNRQAPAIAADLKMPVKEARSIIDNFFKSAPQFYEWRVGVEDTVMDTERALISPFGRLYQAEVVTSSNRQQVLNSGLAFLPQSTASDLCARAAISVQATLNTGAYGDSMIVATIHDAILLDVPDEYVDSVSAMTEKAMVESGRQTFGDAVYFGAEAGAGMSWAECG